MASIVKAPNGLLVDYDYIAFSFNGKHSYDDFGIYRISDDNSGYKESITATREEKTFTVPGKDQEMYLGAQFKNRVFEVKFAFEDLTEEKLFQLKKWLGTKDIHDLWFSENPHKVYSARVTGVSTMHGNPILKNNIRVYNGRGSVQFTCSYPFAHSPRWIQYGTTKLDGKELTSYWQFSNYDEIKEALPGYKKDGNYVEGAMGDQPFTFIANLGRVGYNRLVVHANNGTNAKEVIDWRTSSDLDWKTISNKFTHPVTTYVVSSWNSKADGSGTSITDITGLTGDSEWYAQWSETFSISFYKALDTMVKAHLGSKWTEHTGIQENYGCNISYDGGDNYSVFNVTNYRGKFSDDGFIKKIDKIPSGSKLFIWVKHDTNYRANECKIMSNVTGTTSSVENINPYQVITVDKNLHITFEWDINGILIADWGSSVWNCYIGNNAPDIEEGKIVEWQTKPTQ